MTARGPHLTLEEQSRRDGTAGSVGPAIISFSSATSTMHAESCLEPGPDGTQGRISRAAHGDRRLDQLEPLLGLTVGLLVQSVLGSG